MVCINGEFFPGNHVGEVVTQSELIAGAEPEDGDVRSHTSSGRATLELFLVAFGGLAVSLSQSVLVPVLPELQGSTASTPPGC
jgi:hypothetical protein